MAEDESEVQQTLQGPNDPKYPLVIMVEVEVKPERLEEFIEIINTDAAGSRKENDCYRFDVLRSPDCPY